MHFYHPNLQWLEKNLRRELHESRNATVQCKYGPSPDKPTILLVIAQYCPTFVIHAVPQDCQLLQSIFDKATEMLQLKKDKQLVYKRRIRKSSLRSAHVADYAATATQLNTEGTIHTSFETRP